MVGAKEYIFSSSHVSQTGKLIYPCLEANSLALAFSNLAILARDLLPRLEPPQCLRISSDLSLKLVFTVSTSLFKAPLSWDSTWKNKTNYYQPLHRILIRTCPRECVVNHAFSIEFEYKNNANILRPRLGNRYYIIAYDYSKKPTLLTRYDMETC